MSAFDDQAAEWFEDQRPIFVDPPAYCVSVSSKNYGARCPFITAERDVNPSDESEGYYQCWLVGKEVWGESPPVHLGAMADDPVASGPVGQF